MKIARKRDQLLWMRISQLYNVFIWKITVPDMIKQHDWMAYLPPKNRSLSYKQRLTIELITVFAHALIVSLIARNA